MSFSRYPAYKDSGVEWLGEVPAHWDCGRLSYVASCNDEVLPENTPDDYEIEYVEISGVEAGRGIVEVSTLPFGSAPSRARRVLRDGDILISTVRTYLRAIAQVNAPSDNTIASTGFAVLRPRSVESRYLGYACHAEGFVGEVIARSVGVSYPAINASELVRLQIPLPPSDEQAAIAAFLDRETAKIDALVAEQEKLIGLLKEKRSAVISHAVTKGLDPSAPMKDSGVEWLGEVPAHWNVQALKFIASVQTGVAKGKDNSGKETVQVPYLRVANVQDGYLALDDMAEIEIPAAELPRYTLQAGDVLMNEGGDFDKLGRGHIWRDEIVPCIHQNHVFAVRPHSVSSEWLNTITGSAYAQFYFMSRSKQSTNLASISSTSIMELPVVLPPVEEQEALVSFLEKRTSDFDALVAETRSAIYLLQERRTALISAAVTGQIDIRSSPQS